MDCEVQVTDFSVFAAKDYRRSRGAYHLECAFEYFVSLLVTDSFLALLLTHIGLSESTIGVLSSLISLAFLFELLSIFVVEHIVNKKRFAILFHMAGQLLFGALYLIPFLPIPSAYKGTVCVICILCAYFGNYFVTAMIYKWGNSFVDPRKRGVFSSVKEMISLLSGIVVTVAAGYIMGMFTDAGNTEGWFLFAGISIFVFCLCDLVCLLLIRKEVVPKEQTRTRIPLRTVLHETLGNRCFVNTVILASLFQAACYTAVGFLGTYKNFLYPVAIVQVINAAANLMRFALSRPFGYFSDKFTYAKGLRLGFVVAAIAFAANIFATPDTRFLIIVFTVLYGISGAGTSQNLLNISYSYVDSRYFVQATAIKSSISGLCGFGASVLAGRLLSHIQQNGNTLFGIPVYGQQVLSAISLVLMVAAILFCKFVIEKQKVMLQ